MAKADERLELQKKKQRNFFVVVGILVVISILAYGMYNYMKNDDESEPISYRDNDVSGSDIVLKKTDLSDGKFHYFAHAIDGVSVKYFSVIDDTGKVRTAFDACEVCYEAKKGYTKDGDYAKCQNCGQKFSLSDLGTKNAENRGCWPGYLPHADGADNIRIKISDLRTGRYLFA
ncbi:MAG: Fe-S-containing protein [Thermoplasmatota archaeon]